MSCENQKGGSGFDWLVLLLVSMPAFLGPVLFGCSRILYVFTLLLPCLVGVIFFFAKSGFRTSLHFPPAFGLWGVMLVYLAGVHFVSPLPYVSLANLIGLTGLFFAYLVWDNCCCTWMRCKWFWGAFLVVLTAICWYAVWRHFHGNVGFGHSQDSVLEYGPSHYKMRASGTYICPNHFAHAIVMGICVASALLFVRSGWVLKLISVQYLVVALPCLVQSGSRSGWLGIVAGWGTLFALMLWKKNRWLCVVLMLLFLCVMSGGAYLIWKYVPFVQQRVAAGSAGRLQAWPGVIEMIKDAPLSGWGSGMFRYIYPAYKSAGGEIIVWRYAHNEFLHIVAENGWGGLGLTLLMTVVWYVRWIINYVRSDAWRTSVVSALVLALMTASLVHALFDFNLTMYANASVLVLLVGSATGIEFVARKKREVKSGGFNMFFRSTGLVGALALFGLTLVLFMSQLYVFLGNRQLYVERKYPAALELFDKAEKWYADDFRLHHYKAIAHRVLSRGYRKSPERSQKYRLAALQDHVREYELNPHFTFGVYGLSKVFGEMGEYEMEMAFLKEAISLDPQRTLYWQLYFHRLNALDRPDEIRQGCRLALASGALTEGKVRSVLRKEQIKGIDTRAIAKELAVNPLDVPRRVFVSDAHALLPLFSWEYDEDGRVKSWDHVLWVK